MVTYHLRFRRIRCIDTLYGVRYIALPPKNRTVFPPAGTQTHVQMDLLWSAHLEDPIGALAGDLMNAVAGKEKDGKGGDLSETHQHIQ